MITTGLLVGTGLLCLCGGAPPDTVPVPPGVLSRIDSLRMASRVEDALALIAKELPSARAERDTTLVLMLLMRQGSMWTGFGHIHRAEPVLREALTLAEARSGPSEICYCLRWLGVVLSSQGRGTEAAAIYARLLGLARECDSDSYTGWAYVGLGWQAHVSGSHAEAIALYESAIDPLRRAQMADGLAWGLNGLAAAQANLGQYDEALANYRGAAVVAQDVPERAVRRFILDAVLNNLAHLEYNFGDPGRAAEHFRQTYEMQRESGNVRAPIIPGLNVAMCERELGLHAQAIERLEDLARVCRENGYFDLLGKPLNRLAAIHHSQGQSAEAARLLRQSLALGDSLAAADRVQACIDLAAVLSAMDSTGAALDVLDEGSRLLEVSENVELQLELRANRGRILGALGRFEESLADLRFVEREERRLGLSRYSLSALVAAADAFRQSGQGDSARVVLERAAGIWERDRSVPLDPRWREERGAGSRALRIELADELLNAPGASPSDRAHRAFDRLQVFKARTLLERVRGPGSPPALPESELASLEKVQSEVLQPDELLLDAYLGPRMSLLFAVTTDECRVLRWPAEEELGPRLRRYRRLLSAPPDLDSLLGNPLLEQVETRLRETLLEKVRDLLPTHPHLILAPEGAFNLIPLSSLFQTEIFRVPSATYLSWQRGQHVERPASGPLRTLALAARYHGVPHALPGAIHEVRCLSRAFRHVDVVIGEGSVLSAGLPERLTGYDILHLATHAQADDRNPWRSSISLDPTDQGGHLYADQIADMQLAARLAVLSSCESAAGRVLSGEGVQGLCTAFLSAGVPAVVATLWAVEDRATSDLIGSFYDHLGAGATVAEALARAQAALRDDPRTRHPYYWAGFVLTGAGDVRVDLECRSRIRWWLLVLAACLPFGWLIWRKSRNSLQ